MPRAVRCIASFGARSTPKLRLFSGLKSKSTVGLATRNTAPELALARKRQAADAGVGYASRSICQTHFDALLR